jgi:RNA polymerase sigma-70 factor (ECF subfamily)
MPAEDHEDRLVQRAREGDHEAFNVLAAMYSTRLRRTLYRVTRDCETAADAFQETLLRAWRAMPRFEGRSSFYTWLMRIGLNEAYRALRPAIEEPLELDDRVGEHIPTWGNRPDSVFESREFLAEVERALGELPIDYRVAVTLRDVEGLSLREAADLVGIGERAFKSRLHRGRMALRAMLDDYFAEGYM